MTRMTKKTVTLLSTLAVFAAMSQPAWASFHLMQIERVIAGLNGDASVQAIQLRMRTAFQNQVQLARLVAYDAAGSNPIELIHFPTSVPNHGAGFRVLVASANFADNVSHGLTPDFILTNKIPESYFAAGSLTFEDADTGAIFWRLSWGGDDYTGSHAGELDNDDDGDFGPAYDGPLPSVARETLIFPGSGSAPSTRNVDDYTLIVRDAFFTNNNRQSGRIRGCEPCDALCDGTIDQHDIEPFLHLLFNGGPGCDDCTGDINRDGVVDAFDIEPFLECLFGP